MRHNMTERDIAGVEAAVGVSLPAHYRRFLLEHAGSLRDARRRIPMRALLYFEPGEVIRINKGLRDNPKMIEINEDTEPWSPNYSVVGTNGGGDHWMVDLNDDREAVWKYDSEAGGRIVPAEFQSWAEYMAAVQRDLQEPRKWRG
jgi:cell wall assembly regulator SMI1